MHRQRRARRHPMLILGLILALATTVAGCGGASSSSTANGKPVLNMGVFPALRPLELVRSQHLLEDMGYQVKWNDFIQGAPAEASAMASGSIDFAEGDTSGLEQIAAKSPGLLWYVANGATNYVSVLAKKGSGLTSLDALRGKKVGGVVPNIAPTAVLQMGLAKAGLTLADVQGINVVGPSQPAAMQNNAFDAVTSYVPYSSQMLTDGSAELITTASDIYGSTWLGGGLAVRPEFAKKNEQAVVDVIKAMVQADNILRNKPEEAYSALAKQTQTSIENVKYSYDHKLVGPADVALDKQQLLQQTQVLSKYGVIKVPDISSFVNEFAHPEFAHPEFAQKAAQ